MDYNKLRLDSRHFLGSFGKKIETKYSNVCGKTGQYSVPPELFQKRTSRNKRVLISWKAVCENKLTIEQLDTFENGVVVEFLNNDFFDNSFNDNETYKELKRRLGSDENVSSIISIHSEAGNSSSAVQRKAFEKLINNTIVSYKGKNIVINKDNYTEYALKKNIFGCNSGNNIWSGFLFVSIKGGQQDKIETHAGQELWLFNPACEYASSEVCEDINLVLTYYGLLSVDIEQLEAENVDAARKCKGLISDIEEALSTKCYSFDKYHGNLLDFVKKQYCVSLVPGQLTDPIQLKRILISDFDEASREADSIDLTHNEAVIYERYYWDDVKRCILSPARPTNMFWSFHFSNMIQQNDTFDGYIKNEKERYLKRQQMMK